jgi:hypothetical protein
LGEANHKRRKVLLDLLLVQKLGNSDEGALGLLADNCFVRSGKLLQKRQELREVTEELEATSELLGNGEEDFVILGVNQLYPQIKMVTTYYQGCR